MNERNHVDLFTGLGGFSLAAQANGVRTIAMCECDPRCQAFLAKAWPGVPVWPDVRSFDLHACISASQQYNDGMANQFTPLDPKYQQAQAMYESGMSIADCADYYNVSRQSMWKILKRRGVEFRSQLKYGEDNHWHRGGSNASKRASHMVEMAIKKGVLIPKPCEACGEEAVGHHDDYNKPLEVRWLCKLHHYEWHAKNKAIPLKSALPAMSHEEIVKLTHTPEANAKRWKTRRENKRRKGTPAGGVWLLTAGVP